MVLGVRIGEAAKAYPVTSLQTDRVVNDVLGETNIVVLASELSQAATAYERGDQEFSRLQDDTSTGIPMKVVDQSGQEWNVTEEALVNAADSSQALARIPTHSSFWFGWFAFYPDTELYESGG